MVSLDTVLTMRRASSYPRMRTTTVRSPAEGRGTRSGVVPRTAPSIKTSAPSGSVTISTAVTAGAGIPRGAPAPPGRPIAMGGIPGSMAPVLGIEGIGGGVTGGRPGGGTTGTPVPATAPVPAPVPVTEGPVPVTTPVPPAIGIAAPENA